MFTFAIDKVRLLDHFKKDPVLFAYHIGDLDDFFFPHCQFPSIYSSTARIEDAVLIYSGGMTATILAFGLTDRFIDLFREVREFFPVPFECHFLPEYRPVLAEEFRETALGTFIKMKLEVLREASGTQHDVIRLDKEHAPTLTSFYKRAHPGNYFMPRMLETGKYFGIFDGKNLIATAGVHVYSREYGVAVIGNVATDPSYRNQGLATAVTGHLSRELRDEDLLVCLNVKADNVAAIRCYERLGYVKIRAYEASVFEAKS